MSVDINVECSNLERNWERKTKGVWVQKDTGDGRRRWQEEERNTKVQILVYHYSAMFLSLRLGGGSHLKDSKI